MLEFTSFSSCFDSQIIDVNIEKVAYSGDLSGIMNYIDFHNLGISCVRLGKDMIFFSTNPKDRKEYIEYSQFSTKAEYNNLKNKYIEYLMRKMIGYRDTCSSYATGYALKSAEDVFFYANDDKRVLLWRSTKELEEKREVVCYNDEREFMILTGLPFEKENVRLLSQGTTTNHPAKTRKAPFVEPRRDGYYMAEQIDDENATVSAVLKFQKNGKVMGRIITRGQNMGKAAILDEPGTAVGFYVLKKNEIMISLDSNSKNQMKGFVLDNSIVVSWKRVGGIINRSFMFSSDNFII